MAVTLYADNEANDIRKIEQGVGQGFKFERGAVPSAEQVMSLAGTVAREQIKGVSEEMVGFFMESAQELLAEESSEVRYVRVMVMAVRQVCSVFGFGFGFRVGPGFGSGWLGFRWCGVGRVELS